MHKQTQIFDVPSKITCMNRDGFNAFRIISLWILKLHVDISASEGFCDELGTTDDSCRQLCETSGNEAFATTSLDDWYPFAVSVNLLCFVRVHFYNNNNRNFKNSCDTLPGNLLHVLKCLICRQTMSRTVKRTVELWRREAIS